MGYVWTCHCCGKQYHELPLDFAYKKPDAYFDVPEAEREHRTQIDENCCWIDRERFFVRGCLEIPIIDFDDMLVLGLWSTVSAEGFERVIDLWNAEDLDNEPPLSGLMGTNVQVYPPMLHLRTRVWLRADNLRPRIELEPADHPLFVEQSRGITLARAEELAGLMSQH